MKKIILSILFIGFVFVSFGQNLKGYNIEALHKLEAKRAFIIDLDTFYATTQISSIDTTLATKGYVSDFLEDSIIRIQMPDSTGQFPVWNQDSGFFETTKYIQDYQAKSDTLDWDATKYDLSAKQDVLTNPVTGTGTTNYVSKWTETTTQGNSQIFDNGTNIGINTTTPDVKLFVNGTTMGFPATTGTTQTGSQLRLTATTQSSVTMDFGSFGSNGAWIQATQRTNLANNFPIMLNPNGGNVGIGTTSSITEKLTINGNIKSTTGKFTTLSDNFIPYHVSDASGLANSNVFQTSNRLRYNTTLTTFDNDNDIPNVKWVNSVATGNMPKLPVDAATTTNITLSGTQTIDGYSVTAGMRVLVKNQTTESQNGVYVVAAGAWSRSTDLDTWGELYKAYVAVLNGAVSSGAAYVCTIPVTGTLETDDITWILYNAPSNILVNSPLSKSGNTISLNYDTGTLDVASGNLKVKDNIYQPKSTILTNTTATYLDSDSIKLAGLIENSVPDDRTLTINGTTQDLSANRTWNVGTVTSVATGLGMTGGTITTSGTVSLDTTSMVVLSRQRAANTYQSKGSYLSLTGGTMTGTITLPASTVQTAVTGLTTAPLYQNSINTGTGGFVPFLHGRTTITGGYVKHINIGAYRTGTGWNGGIYFAQGGNDANPTEYFLMGYGGTLTHSNGSTFYNSLNSNLSSVDWNMKNLSVNGTATGTQDATLSNQFVRLGQLSSYLPTSRNLTINGTTYDLSLDRTWNVGTVTSIATGLGLTGGTITGSGTVLVDTANVSILSRQRAANTYQLKGTYLTSETDPIYSVSSWFSTTNNSTNWNNSFNDKINSIAFSGTSTKTLTLTQQDGGTVSNTFTDLDSQNLTKSKTGNNVTVNISGGTGTIFSVADADSLTTNEIQSLSIDSTTSTYGISISSGNRVHFNKNAMVYPGAGIPISTGSAWGTSITNNSTNWNTAYTDRNKWDGGETGLNASTGRTSLGATTIGSNLFTSTNPSAVRFLRANADNTVSWLTASDFVTAIGAGTSSGTVSSVAMTVPTGLTVSGSPITSSGTLAVSLQSGYSIPTTTNQTNWSTAYGWGNHATAGYLTDDSNYAKLNSANIFTANQNISKTTPIFNIKSTDATARKIEFLNSSSVGVGNITSNIDGTLDIQGSTDIELNAGSGNNFRVTGSAHYAEGLENLTQTNFVGYNSTTGALSYYNLFPAAGIVTSNGSAFSSTPLYTAGSGLQLSGSNQFAFNFNGLGLISGGSIVDGDFMSVYDESIGTHYKLPMGGLKTYLDIPAYTAGSGLQLSSDQFSLNLNGLGLISGGSIVDSDLLGVYDASIGNHYKLTMGGLKTYLNIPSAYTLPLAANGTRGGIQIGYTSTANNFALNLSSEKAYTALPDATTTVKGIASFNTNNFSTTSGAVSIKSGGVTASNLNNNVISGQTDIGTNISDADIFLISDGSVIRKTAASRLKTYIGASGSLWTDAGTYTYLTSTTDKLNIGYSTDVSAAKLAVNGNADINGSIQSVVSYTDTWYSAAYGLESNELSAKPSTPSSGTGQFYAKNDNKPYFQNDSGTEYDLTGLVMPIKSITTSTALASTDYTILMTSSGASISSIPSITGKIFIIANMTGTTLTIPTVWTSNSATTTLISGGAKYMIQYDGSKWWVINTN